MLSRFLSFLLVIASFAWSPQVSGIRCCEIDSCCPNEGGFQVYADYLYWKVVQDQIAYATNGAPNLRGPIVGSSSTIKVVEPSFKYHSGFRIGGGYQVPCANWDFQVAWTRLHDKHSSSVSHHDQIFTLASLIAGLATAEDTLFADSARSNWHFKYDTVDLQVGGSCSALSCIAVRPFVGARLAQIDQKQNIEYGGLRDPRTEAPLFVSIARKNKFRGVGPSIGLDAHMKFWCQWSLFGGVSGSLLYGRFDVKNEPTFSEADLSITIDYKNHKKYRLRPNVDTYFGIGWESAFSECYQIKVGVAYEMQYWWNQWQAPANIIGSVLTGANSPQGDLMLHGLTARVGVSF